MNKDDEKRLMRDAMYYHSAGVEHIYDRLVDWEKEREYYRNVGDVFSKMQKMFVDVLIKLQERMDKERLEFEQ